MKEKIYSITEEDSSIEAHRRLRRATFAVPIIEVIGTPNCKNACNGRMESGHRSEQTLAVVIKMCHEAGIYDQPQPHHRPVRRKYSE